MYLPLLTPQVTIDKTLIILDKPPAIVKEVTLEDKIKQNFYKCNTDTQWIRADNAQCLDKVTTQAQTPVRGAVNSSGNGYEYHQCTWHAKNMRPDLPNNLGNAYSWVANAAAQGFATGSVPRAGAVGQQGNHVVYIERVNSDGTVYLSERNWDYNGSFRYRTAPASNFIYIY
jgi:surface antigen